MEAQRRHAPVHQPIERCLPNPVFELVQAELAKQYARGFAAGDKFGFVRGVRWGRFSALCLGLILGFGAAAAVAALGWLGACR